VKDFFGTFYVPNNASLVAIEPKSGSIKAYVGSMNYFGEPLPKGCTPGKSCLFDPQRDAARSLRQPGSSFKPYVYVTAFGEKFKMTPASIISDSPTTFTGSGGSAYTPHNYTGKSYGNIPARKALAGSLNIAAVNLLAKIGQEDTIKTTRNLGISAPLKNCGLSLALGACEMTLLEHTAAFAGLANMGNFYPPHAIASITDHAGGIIMENKTKPTRAVEAAASYEVLDIMSDNQARSYIFGSHSPLAFLDRQVAVKTGTTQNWRDSWTVGGTPDLTLGIWMGNNNGQVMRAGSDSIVTAAPLWRKILDTTITESTTKTFEEPFGISRVTVDTKTGKVIKPKKINSATLQPIADYAINIDIPKIAKPKVLGATRPSIPEDTEVATVILDPWENQTIFETPFEVKVYTGGSTEGATVTLNLDGHIIASKTSPPFFFTIPDNLQNGWHRLTATTNHFGLVETTDSIKFRTQFNPKPIKPRGE
jgi:membrane peptidoglycan carboxypeptidase